MRFLLLIPLISFGNTLIAQEDIFAKALESYSHAEYNDAFLLFEEAANAFRLNDQYYDYASCHINMASCYAALNLHQESFKLASNSLAYINDLLAGDSLLSAKANHIMGDAKQAVGRNEQAINHFIKAAEIYPSTSKIDKANSFYAIGNLYQQNENTDLALKYFQLTLVEIKEVTKQQSLTAEIKHRIGLMYLDKDPDIAFKYINDALPIYISSHGEINVKTIGCLLDLARTKHQQGNNEEALDLVTRIKSIITQLYLDDHPISAQILQVEGNILADNNQLDEAIHLHERSLKMNIRLKGVKHPEVALNYFNLGELFLRQNSFFEAAQNFHKSIYANSYDQFEGGIYDLPNIDNYYDHNLLMSSLIGKGKSLEAYYFNISSNEKDLDHIVKIFEKCDTLYTQIINLRVNADHITRLAEWENMIYEKGLRLSLVLANQQVNRAKYFSKAYEFSERKKSLQIRKVIKQMNPELFFGVPKKLLSLEDSLIEEVNFAYRMLLQDAEHEIHWKDESTKFKKELKSHFELLAQNYPRYYNLMFNNEIIPLLSLEESIPSGSAILSYFVNTNKVYGFYIDSKDYIQFEFYKDEKFLQNLTAYLNSVMNKDDDSYIATGTYLYNLLIPKISDDVKHLYIIPDGILRNIPFEALSISPRPNNDQHKFIVENFDISYHYSASSMYASIHAKKSNESKIVLVAPTINTPGEGSLASTSNAHLELGMISDLFKSNHFDALSLSGSDASVSFKKVNLNRIRYLHFATPFFTEIPSGVERSLRFTSSSNQSGYIPIKEIYNMHVGADLVTFSRRIVDMIFDAEDLIGITTAWSYAGANNLMIPMWQVENNSTVEFTFQFYKNHLGDRFLLPFHQALGDTKRGFIKSSELHHPYYWSSPILIGY